jgi:hypothetical protein
MPKSEILWEIINADNGLSIENVFGEIAGAKFLGLQADDVIVVCGNGPVSYAYGAEIDSAKLVVRCNHWKKVFGESSAMVETKYPTNAELVGQKCDLHFVCLHGGEFKKNKLQFLRDWCRESPLVLALENSSAKQPIYDAVKASKDLFFSKFCLPEEKVLARLFATDCTRGFYAIAFALQAKRRLGLKQAVKCIGFGGRGHHDDAKVRIFHGHDEEMLLWADMWKMGTDLVHLEWDLLGNDLLASMSN